MKIKENERGEDMKIAKHKSPDTVRERERERELYFSEIKNSFVKYIILKDSNGSL